MTVKYDIEALKSDTKNAALRCAKAKHRLRETQRVLSGVRHAEKWGAMSYDECMEYVRKVNTSRAEAGDVATAMTKLCVFKAHLRGRTHLSAGSNLLEFVKGWIEELASDYALEPQIDKPAA